MPNWTKEQEEAINKKGTNIIVSAGAGSGKTAVLSTRVIRILKENIHINELLILTFTNAAAAEMKNRIRKLIKKDESLIKELELLDASYITTFDSFALSIVKKYHYLLNISPNVKIVDSNIITLKKEKILDEILEELYEKEDDKLVKLINDFCIKDDNNIRNAILNISSSLDLNVDKNRFIHNYVENFYEINKIKADINEYISLIKKYVEKINILLEDLRYESNEEYYLKYIEVLNPLLESNSYIEYKENSNVKLPALIRNSTDELKRIKEKISSSLDEIKDLTSYESIDELEETILSTKDYAKIILEIIEKLDKKLNKYKFDNDMYEFNDIALLALKLVREKEEVRQDLKNKFKEILVDEYQDTNDIQEEFISLISNNNVYMVGDIKQSIYRFRNANPNIFKNKYDAYKDNNNGIKIDLNKNFRSREEVLNNINKIFDIIMNDNIGGANYKKEHNMIFGNKDYNIIGNTNQNNDIEILSYKNYKEQALKKEEIEAFIIADDILDKVNNKYKIYDKDNQLIRDVTYNDFVILMDRTTNFDTYKKVFTSKGIPLKQVKDEKMNEEVDLSLIKNIIKFIIKVNKKEMDEEFKYLFISIERSFLVNENDNTIFEYFTNNKFSESEIYNKCLNISYELDNLSIEELIDRIITEFNYYEKLITVGNIESSLIVIENIKNNANALEELGYTKEEFVEYLDESIKYDIKYSLTDNTSNSVSIMTIHKSKGLEYHICYYSGLYKKFNIADLKDRFLYDSKYGLILPYFKEGIGTTIYKRLLKENYIKEEISEKIRLFYVALTRAKEKMILVEPETEEIKSIDPLDYRSFKDILDSIKLNIIDYYKVIDVNEMKIDNNYNLSKNNNILDKIPTNNIKIDKLSYNEDLNLIEKDSYSKKQTELIDIKIKNNLEYGKKIHEVLELVDFKNPNYELLDNHSKKIVSAFLNNDLFKNIKDAKIYKEYEFIYEEEQKEHHGIIDLMIEYKDHIDIFDYKLSNIEDESYLKQLNGYKNYIKTLTDKPINIYLYSILNNEIKKIC